MDVKKKSKKSKNLKKKEKDRNLSEKVNQLETQLKRALADYQNLSRRIEDKQCSWRNRAAARMIDKLLDVYDDFLLAEKQLQDKGLSIAVDQFWSVLSSEGVEKISCQDREFDADLMDCVKMVNGGRNQVIDIIKPGYLLNNEVVRPAKVTVGKGPVERDKKENKDE